MWYARRSERCSNRTHMAPPGVKIKATVAQSTSRKPPQQLSLPAQPAEKHQKITSDMFAGYVESTKHQVELDAEIKAQPRKKLAPARMRKTSYALGTTFNT